MSLTVPVALSERSYDIHIGTGLIASAGELVAAQLGHSAPRRVPVVTDQTVASLYYTPLAASLAAADLVSVPIVLPRRTNQELCPPGTADRRAAQREC